MLVWGPEVGNANSMKPEEGLSLPGVARSRNQAQMLVILRCLPSSCWLTSLHSLPVVLVALFKASLTSPKLAPKSDPSDFLLDPKTCGNLCP